ncbi:MAG: hypothetical protein Q4P24_11000 [Rhodobacterales bacterium]|nr:hypothetical protein [Rhodobacterales bacterium]
MIWGHSGREVDRVRATLRRVVIILVNDGAVVGAKSKQASGEALTAV